MNRAGRSNPVPRVAMAHQEAKGKSLGGGDRNREAVGVLKQPNIKMDKVPAVVKGAKGGLLTAVEIPDEIIDSATKTMYKRGRFLGKGGFAKCYEVTKVSSVQEPEILACKIVNKSMLVKPHHRDKMAMEIQIHRTLEHPNIVGFHSYFQDDLFVYVILELCEKKSLMELSRRRKVITEPEAKYFLKQICEAVRYLHEEKKIIHRDLKLGNIFIGGMNIKVGDFGLASMLDSDGIRKKTLCGTPNYIAPEVLNKTGHGFEVDIWSIGCVLYTLLLGKPPFETDNIRETYRRIKEGDFRLPTGRISTEARSLIKRMLQVDPSKRPSARQVLLDDFLTKGFIPDALPTTALTVAPRFQKTKIVPSQQHPNVPMKVSKTNVVSDENVASASGKVYAPMDVDGAGNGSEDTVTSDNGGSIQDLITSLHAQLKNSVEAWNCHQPLVKDDDNEMPALAPMLFVIKWVDYSDKYGFGYQLSDDSIGVSFNDCTRVILYPTGSLTFFNKQGEESHHDEKAYPATWEKKVRLMNHFKQYMTQYLQKPIATSASNQTCIPRVPTLYTWFRTSKSVVMCFQNGTVQINNFRTHRKIILCPVMGAMSVMEQSQPMRTFSLSLILSNGCSRELHADLLYSLAKLETLRSAASNLLHTAVDAKVGNALPSTQAN